ncbi:GxxExxY protein [Flavobacterium sp. 3HN19-14]|uniref:GxxExxY protein n=1 Tax=Flavobacterium sp. 3HN19-14 TaxID=3448133 RepID=UPI003EE1C3F6
MKKYKPNGIIQKEEYYKIVGICMEIHNILGPGLSEVIYKDALEFEFKSNSIPFEREKAFVVNYKNVTLAHQYYADFIVYDEIILEVKAIKEILSEHISQTINYIRLAGSEIGIIVNFSKSVQHKRLVI